MLQWNWHTEEIQNLKLLDIYFKKHAFIESAWFFIWMKWQAPRQIILCAKFDWNNPAVLKKDDKNVKSIRRHQQRPLKNKEGSYISSLYLIYNIRSPCYKNVTPLIWLIVTYVNNLKYLYYISILIFYNVHYFQSSFLFFQFCENFHISE